MREVARANRQVGRGKIIRDTGKLRSAGATDTANGIIGMIGAVRAAQCRTRSIAPDRIIV
jgi:hypothetical protein